MKISILLAVLVLAGSVWAQNAQTPAKGKEKIDPSLIDVQDEAGLPRVLIIGDSISMGYTIPVREKLKGVANVHRPTENCGDTERGIKGLDQWLGDGKWDVIHFNFGLHDLKYVDDKGEMVAVSKGHQNHPVDVYEQNIRAIVARLKKTGAKVIWASTTPVPEGTTGRVKDSEIPYNEAAEKVMKEEGVAIDDLHALVVPRQSEIQLKKNVHFSKKGYDVLADQVVAEVRGAVGK